jgi:hypothetical protein
MEINGLPVKAEQLMHSLQKSSSEISVSNSISVYEGVLTIPCIAENMKAIELSFPQLDPGFYDILTKLIKEDGFTDQRLTDAVKHLIKTCVYPTPTIANILNFDKRMKLNTYNDMVSMVDEYGQKIWEMYFKRKINDTTYWISKREADQYGIKYE